MEKETNDKWYEAKESAINCRGPYKLLGECQGDIEGTSEMSFICSSTWRPNDKATRRLRICQEHRNFLGKSFKDKTADRNRKCRYCGHLPGSKSKEVRAVSYEFSEDVRKKGGKYLPVTCPICTTCRTKITGWKKEQPEPMNDEEPSSQESHTSGTSYLSSEDPRDKNWEPMDTTITETLTGVQLVNKFLEDNGKKSTLTSQLHQPWDQADASRKRKILRVAADMGEATMDAITPHLSNKLEILKELSKKKKIERQIDPKGQHVSSLLQDIVITHNLGDRETKKKVIAMGSRVLSFSDMDKCNPPREKNALRRAIQESRGDAFSSDSESDSDSEKQNPAPNGLFFTPRLTKWFYRECNFHRLRNGHGLAPAKRRGYVVHRVSPAMLSAIYSFITSHEVTKATAFGKCITVFLLLSYVSRHESW